MEGASKRGSVASGPSGIALSHGLAPAPIRFPSPRVASLSLEPESLPSNAASRSSPQSLPQSSRNSPRRPSVNIISSSPAESNFSNGSASTLSDSTAIPGSPAFSTRTLRPKPRPSLPRPDSKIYDSLPFEPPQTPWKEPAQDDSWLAFFGLSSLSGQSNRNAEEQAQSDLERQGLLGGRTTGNEYTTTMAEREGDLEMMMGRKEGLPKLSRECLISEIKCYGKHMLPPIIFFVVFVLGFGLWLYHKQRGD